MPPTRAQGMPLARDADQDLSKRYRKVKNPGPPPAPMEASRRAFLFGLGLVQALAFVSLWVQWDALAGPEGILPVSDTLEAVRAEVALGDSPWRGRLARVAAHPTLAWVLPAGWLGALACGVGLVASVMVMLRRWAGPALLTVFACYLSLTVSGGPFLSFQWDALLLEVTFAALLIAPWGAREQHAPWAPGWWVLRWILFRLVFFGGLVKLTSGDPTWRDLSALTFHYETQPLPNPVSWYAQQLHWTVQSLSTLLMFAVELVVVFGVFGPRRLRAIACAAIVGLMALLELTGNFGWFQLLTAVLCLSLLDDRHWRWLTNERWKPDSWGELPRPGKAAVAVVAGALVALSLAGIPSRYARIAPPEAVVPVLRAAAPFRIVNHYGLFAVMTTSRPIPILEARWSDGDWTELTWSYQTSDPAVRPPQVAPHMPRLDWQLWFWGLGGCDDPLPARLLDRVLDGSEPVARQIGDLRLLTSRPPDAVRLSRWTYRFAEPGSDVWWTRERTGGDCPSWTRGAVE